MVTREKYQAAYELYRWWGWSPRMIAPHVGLKPWEAEAICEQIDSDLKKESRPQLELFKPKRDVA